MFDDLLKTIFNKTVNESNSSTKNETVNESNSSTKNESNSDNKIDNENKTVHESKSDNKNDNDSDNDSDNYSDNENENESKNESKKYTYYDKIKELNNWFETIDQTTSLEDQIEILKRKDFLDYYWSVSYYNNNKDLNYKLFKVKAAYLLNDLDEHLFKKIFGCKFTTLAEKLINTVDTVENQIIIDNIINNRDKIYSIYRHDVSVIRHIGDLSDAVKIISKINEILKSDKVDDNDLMELYKI